MPEFVLRCLNYTGAVNLQLLVGDLKRVQNEVNRSL